MTASVARVRGANRANLYRYGYEYAADRVYRALRSMPAGAVVTAAVLPGGDVQVLRSLSDDALLALSETPRYVGTYTRQTQINVIEDDFLMWMREVGLTKLTEVSHA